MLTRKHEGAPLPENDTGTGQVDRGKDPRCGGPKDRELEGLVGDQKEKKSK